MSIKKKEACEGWHFAHCIGWLPLKLLSAGVLLILLMFLMLLPVQPLLKVRNDFGALANSGSRSNSTQLGNSAVCLTGLYRTGDTVLPHVWRMYKDASLTYFVVTNHIPEIMKLKFNLSKDMFKLLPEEESSQATGLIICHELISTFERNSNWSFQFVFRQRIDVIGCAPPHIADAIVKSSSPFILVPHGQCQPCTTRPCVADNWAFMTRTLFGLYVIGLSKPPGGFSQEEYLYFTLKANKHLTIWMASETTSRLCFRIIRRGCGTQIDRPQFNAYECDAHSLRLESAAFNVQLLGC
eukprot:TRINITY_DN52170_c0_g1_i1.p1 TRINITY_DN52170_c0_g1~~TRINITY_DN52170_c0_g1_i1.p1  ORF type:complete len:320 (-),score=-1.17 TRINITY_DN52170_c0_g1_i1:187-1077(-)